MSSWPLCLIAIASLILTASAGQHMTCDVTQFGAVAGASNATLGFLRAMAACSGAAGVTSRTLIVPSTKPGQVSSVRLSSWCSISHCSSNLLPFYLLP